MIDTTAILQQGSQLKADYEVTWDKDGFFWDSRNQAEEKSNRMPLKTARQYRSETSRHEVYNSQLAADHTRRKRFKVKDWVISWLVATMLIFFCYLLTLQIVTIKGD